MKLQSLSSFETLNTETIKMVVGGQNAPSDSKKKDVTSTSQDSASNDHYDYSHGVKG